ncbi:MAG: RIP metalloprotease RseP [Nitrospinae bacterium]|nr:RIP metalloprotease RseP [Nitrospinota bacterium]
MSELSLLPLDAILGFATKMLVFIIGLAALIFVHELGHFLAARKVGVTVEKFSLGFGPKLLGYKSGETEYLLSAIPLGGYVKMKGEDPGETVTDMAGSFSSAPVKHRLAIAFAGPFFNILFAVFIYIVVYLNGVPTLSTLVGSVRDNSPAQAAGLKTGDRIVEIDGQKIRFWERLLEIVHKSPGKRMDFQVERPSADESKSVILNFSITPISEEITTLFGDKEQVGLIGISPLSRKISFVQKDSPADRAGLREGDELLTVDNAPVLGWPDLKTAAIDKPGTELVFHVKRDGAEMDFRLTPESKVVKDPENKNVEMGVIGIGLGGEMLLEQYGFLGSVLRSLRETVRLTHMIALSVKKMVVGSIPSDSIGGPILIFQIYGEQAKQGFNELIRLTALLSINLGLLNLLPIPILDGGHIFFFLIELLKGKPVSERSRERAQQVGLFMLISLMVFAFYNDIMRIIN